ncbi:MAG: hypothetical protein PARBA_02348 [Parabacteroides sp.]
MDAKYKGNSSEKGKEEECFLIFVNPLIFMSDDFVNRG